MFVETDFHRDELGIDLPDEVIFEIITKEMKRAYDSDNEPAFRITAYTGKTLLMWKLRKLRKRFNEEHNFRDYVLEHYQDEEPTSGSSENNRGRDAG